MAFQDSAESLAEKLHLSRVPRPVIAAMFDWGMDYKRKNGSPANALVEALGAALH